MLRKLPKEKRIEVLEKVYCDAVSKNIILPSGMLGEMHYQKSSQTYYDKGLFASFKRGIFYLYRIGGYNDINTIKEDIIKVRNEIPEWSFDKVILPTNIPNSEIEAGLNKVCIDDDYLRAFYIDVTLDKFDNKYLKKRGIDKLDKITTYRRVNKEDLVNIRRQFDSWKNAKLLKGDKIGDWGENAFRKFTDLDNFCMYGFYYKDMLMGYQSLKMYDNHAFIYLENILDDRNDVFEDVVKAMYEEYKNISSTGYDAFFGLVKSRLKKLMLYKMVKNNPDIKIFNIDYAGGRYPRLVAYKKNYYKHSTRLVEIKLGTKR